MEKSSMIGNLFDKLEAEHNQKILNNLKLAFEQKEEEIYRSEWRKRNGFVAKGTRVRNIETGFGPIALKRRRYKYWDDKTKTYKYKCLVDDEIEIEKYQRYHPYFRLKILAYAADGKRYRDIIDIFKFANLTQSTISNIISRSDLLDWDQFLSQNKINVNKYLYILIDDTFPRVRVREAKRKSKILKTRLITFHTGRSKKQPRPDRFSLDNKRSFYLSGAITKDHKAKKDELIDHINNFKDKFYSATNGTKLIVCGDGAPWIQELSSDLGAEFVLDKYHALRDLSKTLQAKRNPYYFNLYQHAKNLFSAGNATELISFLEKLKRIDENIDQKKIKTLIAYLKKRIKAIETYSQTWNIGCSTEAMISRIVKSPIRGTRCYSEKNFKTLLNIRIAKINQVDLINILEEEIENDFKIKTEINRSSLYFKTNTDFYEPKQGRVYTIDTSPLSMRMRKILKTI